MKILTLEKKNELLKNQGSKYLSADYVPSMGSVSEPKKDEYLNTVFARHPIYGFPCSDLEVKDSDVSDSLKQNIMARNKPVQSDFESSVDDDVLLDGMRQPYESEDDYIKRMQDDVKDSLKKTD